MNSDLASEILSLTLEHLAMVAITIAIAIAIALPAGVLLARRPGPRRWAVGFANIAQTIPSLALFGFLVPLPFIGGIGKRTAIVALCLYALLPILRNTLLGITGVDASVRESAVAMGMTARQILWQVELPLAAPSIVAGLRLATVATIGTATIAAAIGGGGLGRLHLPRDFDGGHAHRAGGRAARRRDGAGGRRGAGMDRTKNLACLTALALTLAGVRTQARAGGGLQEFHRAGAAGGDSGAAHRAPAAHSGGTQVQSGRHPAGAHRAHQRRHRPLPRVQRHRAHRRLETAAVERPGRGDGSRFAPRTGSSGTWSGCARWASTIRSP